MQTQTNWTQTASQLKLENKLKTTRKANTTKTRDYHDKTGNRQRARDREGERNLTDTQRYDWGNGQLNIETRQAQITNTGDAGEDTQWQTQKGNRLNKQVTKN